MLRRGANHRAVSAGLALVSQAGGHCLLNGTILHDDNAYLSPVSQCPPSPDALAAVCLECEFPPYSALLRDGFPFHKPTIPRIPPSSRSKKGSSSRRMSLQGDLKIQILKIALRILFNRGFCRGCCAPRILNLLYVIDTPSSPGKMSQVPIRYWRDPA